MRTMVLIVNQSSADISFREAITRQVTLLVACESVKTRVQTPASTLVVVNTGCIVVCRCLCKPSTTQQTSLLPNIL